MNTIKITNIFVLFAFCIFQSNNLFSIARYKAQPLDSLQHKLHNNEIGFEYKFFNKRDCKKYLGRRRILSKGYVPVQISITNNTDQSFKFSPYNTTLSNVSYYNVAQKVQFNTFGRVFAWIIPWTILLPFSAYFSFCIGIHALHDANAPGILLSLFSALLPFTFSAIASIEGIESNHSNKNLITDYEHKSLKSSKIQPHSTINGILFVNKKEFNPEFSLTVTNVSNNEQHTLSTDAPSIKVNQSESYHSTFIPNFSTKNLLPKWRLS